MCGRYAFFSIEELADRYNLDESLVFEPNYNIAPGSTAPVVTRNSPNKGRVMRWGLVPSWSKEFKSQFSTFNARLDSLQHSRLYGPLLKNRRCLIPVNGYYEWEQQGARQPHFFSMPQSQLFSLAGLYDVWRDAEGKEFFSYTIITTVANDLMRPIHARMPVMVEQVDELTWLDCDKVAIDSALEVLRSQNNILREFAVSTKVNSAVNNSKELVVPVEAAD